MSVPVNVGKTDEGPKKLAAMATLYLAQLTSVFVVVFLLLLSLFDKSIAVVSCQLFTHTRFVQVL